MLDELFPPIIPQPMPPPPDCSLLVVVTAVSKISPSAMITCNAWSTTNMPSGLSIRPAVFYHTSAGGTRGDARRTRNLSHMEPLPPTIERKRRSLARALGRPVYIRGVRTPDSTFRGRLSVEPGRVIVEYQVSQAGYFWHIPIIEELLDRAAAGQPTAELRASAGPPKPPPRAR
jgi:hypothetical protein